MGVLRLIRRYERGRRFWRRVAVTGPDDCWRWLGPTDRDGEGILDDGRSAPIQACELAGRPVPLGAAVDHECGNCWCVNPRHLVVRRAST